MSNVEENSDMSLFDLSLQQLTQRFDRSEKENHEKFGKIDEKFGRMEERQQRQENDITSVKADVTFIKETVSGLASDLKEQKKEDQRQKDDQHKQMRGLLGKFFVGIAVTVLGGALLVAFGLK